MGQRFLRLPGPSSRLSAALSFTDNSGMNLTLHSVLAIVAGYLIGSVSFAIVVSKFRGLDDPRQYGSGNPGATNVLRSGDKTAALLTLLGDALKGVVAVLLAKAFADTLGLDNNLIAAVGLAAFLGHLFPVFHGFTGGKGVATAAGVLLALQPVLGLATLATWLIIAFFFRISSLAALVAAVFSPIYEAFLFGPSWRTALIAVMGALLVWRHRSNISNLLAGKEPRIGAKKKAEPQA